MSPAQMVVQMARVGRQISRAGKSWGEFRKSDEPTKASRDLRETRQALKAALACLDRMDPPVKEAE